MFNILPTFKAFQNDALNFYFISKPGQYKYCPDWACSEMSAANFHSSSGAVEKLNTSNYLVIIQLNRTGWHLAPDRMSLTRLKRHAFPP